ncbi:MULTISPECIES: ferritin-like domain-containing protein [Tsukamurella]|uniref:ferritin-like domain-containing protein n=1 Tax=Tsukamurella TaxID=2060 RepID=UPI001786B93D|nr:MULTISPECIES: ferritin-like domain-containing protein [Tsukamurella]
MEWVEHFEDRARRRRPDPVWSDGAALPPAVIASLQRFQVGESGDGATLSAHAEAAGDPHYAAAVRLFVAEENEHARLLAELIRAGGGELLDGHWSDTVFVRARRALGLRCELLVLTVAELIAVSYYGALAQSPDPLLAEVSRRILDDEQYHIRFQRDRLSEGFAATPAARRRAIGMLWQGFACAVSIVVAADHGPALVAVGGSRRALVQESAALFGRFRRDVFAPAHPRTRAIAEAGHRA